MALKNSFEQGSIDKALYDRELQKLAREYKFQIDSLSSDVNFWKGQQGKTDERLKTLDELNRINKIVLNKKPTKPTAPGQKKTELEATVAKLQSIGCFQVGDVWTEPEIK